MRRSKASKQASKQGFTLIEVLIVVVIIGVLAALVIPRMIASVEKAKIAEAYQMLGALIRAQRKYMDFNGSLTPIYLTCDNPPGPCNQAAALGSLGISDIQQKEFRYICTNTGADYCVASRWKLVGGQYPSIARYYTGVNSDRWQCDAGYVTADGGVAGLSDTGCVPGW